MSWPLETTQTETVCMWMFIRTETVSVMRCFGNQQRGKIRVIKGDGSDGPQKWNELCLVLVDFYNTLRLVLSLTNHNCTVQCSKL